MCLLSRWARFFLPQMDIRGLGKKEVSIQNPTARDRRSEARFPSCIAWRSDYCKSKCESDACNCTGHQAFPRICPFNPKATFHAQSLSGWQSSQVLQPYLPELWRGPGSLGGREQSVGWGGGGEFCFFWGVVAGQSPAKTSRKDCGVSFRKCRGKK